MTITICATCGRTMTPTTVGPRCFSLPCLGLQTVQRCKRDFVDQKKIAALVAEKTELAEQRGEALIMSDLEFDQAVAQATHQHKYGGLYQYVGLARSAADGKTQQEVYRHLYPFKQELRYRDPVEFNEADRFMPLPLIE
jgi:fido (protein-threonine AMPylation protein)